MNKFNSCYLVCLGCMKALLALNSDPRFRACAPRQNVVEIETELDEAAATEVLTQVLCHPVRFQYRAAHELPKTVDIFPRGL